MARLPLQAWLVLIGAVCAMVMVLVPSISPAVYARLTPEQWFSIIFLFALYLLADANVIRWHFPQATIDITVSTGIDMALVLLFGPAVALPFVALAVLATELYARKPFYKLLFNVAQFVLATSASSFIFGLLGTVGASPFESGRQVLAWILAAAVYVLVNTALLALMISSVMRAPFFSLWRDMVTGAEMQQWTQPLLGALIAVLGLHSPWALVLSVLPLVAIYISYRRYLELGQQARRVIETLADALDRRDPLTFQHSQRVTDYTQRILETLGSTPLNEVETILNAARIHDLGKLGIPDRTLHKQGPLTNDERREMEHHPVIGAQLLTPLSLYQEALVIVRHHHERWDGAGYPDGLAGEQIPFGARVLGVADAFDAMTSDRPYRRAKSIERALAEIEKGRGAQFDPAIVEAFLTAMRGSAHGQSAFLSNSSHGPARATQPASAYLGRPDRGC